MRSARPIKASCRRFTRRRLQSTRSARDTATRPRANSARRRRATSPASLRGTRPSYATSAIRRRPRCSIVSRSACARADAARRGRLSRRFPGTPTVVPRRSVLVVGSGPIVIGQAAEFDYAGVQACRALREEGHRVVLVNSNPATIMTDPEVADAVYLEPLTVPSLQAIIARERPDALLPTLGGQTGLNLAVELDEAGVLERYGVELLGTPVETIKLAEDRELFKRKMIEIGEPVPESAIITEVEQGVEFASRMGYPLVVRPAYTLGGTGGGIVYD